MQPILIQMLINVKELLLVIEFSLFRSASLCASSVLGSMYFVGVNILTNLRMKHSSLCYSESGPNKPAIRLHAQFQNRMNVHEIIPMAKNLHHQGHTIGGKELSDSRYIFCQNLYELAHLPYKAYE